MAGIRDILNLPIMYRIWQFQFAYQKMKPVRKDQSLAEAVKVLDVGCGPGTNAKYFTHADYLGLDINERYISNARQRYPGEFRQCAVCTYQPEDGQAFDYIFLNSFLHHIDDENTSKILNCLHGLLTPNDSIHILDLVLPENRCIAKRLAKKDRGDFARPIKRWREIFSGVFSTIHCELFAVRGLGIKLWSMVYFKGAQRATGVAL